MAFVEFIGDGAVASAALGAANGSAPDAASVAYAFDVEASADGPVDNLPNREEQSQHK